MDIQVLIRKLVSYGVQTGLVPEEDVIYTTNRLLELFELDELEVIWILPSICPSPRRILKPSPQQSSQSSPVIRNACCAVKMRVMQAV